MRLRFLPRAADELEGIIDYLVERSPQGAHHVRQRIQDMIQVVLQYPESGTRTSYRNLRRITVTPYPYFVFYEATDDEVVIVGVRHSARNPSTMPGGSV